MITKLAQVIDLVKSKPKKRLVAAFANDDHTIEAVNNAVELGIVDAILVGDEPVIRQVCKQLNIDADKFVIVHEPDEMKAATKSCNLINQKEADILMKGALSTDKYMRAILNKEQGLCPPNAVLSHVAVVENPAYHKLLIASDCAIIPAPDLKQKQMILQYIIRTAKAIGLTQPKVAIIAATEQMSAGMPACVDAAILAKMADRGQITGALIDGPISLDVAVDEETAKTKKMVGGVAGDADGLLFPNIESGNIFYKCSTKFNNAEVGAFLAGAKAPCVLSSRADTSLTKLYSIAMAAVL
ncbi:MAG: phosphate acyltransferase [Bacteroidetes bacterium]|nr:phosphate acyltransferase [Bacteroidota bacterium]MCL2302593.1 phosphate acyltransferase [Lentimicrobiaceae bacterium]